MEDSGSEAVFDSLNLNPQLFLNEILNSVDDLVDGAFDFYHQEASTLLKIEDSERSEDLKKGVGYIRNRIQSALDKRLAMWEKYSLQHCFRLPEGFSLPKSNESPGDSLMDSDSALNDPELDKELDSLRDKLNLVGGETAALRRELQTLERQSELSNRFAGSVNEVLKLYDQDHAHVMFQDLVTTATEFRAKMETLKAKREEEAQRYRTERMRIENCDLFAGFNHKNGGGLFNIKLECLQEFIDDLQLE